MPDRYQVIGPPGTGKTTYLKRQVERAASQLGPSEVMVCSLTRAAAAEIRGRELPIPADRVETTLQATTVDDLGGALVHYTPGERGGPRVVGLVRPLADGTWRARRGAGQRPAPR